VAPDTEHEPLALSTEECFLCGCCCCCCCCCCPPKNRLNDILARLGVVIILLDAVKEEKLLSGDTVGGGDVMAAADFIEFDIRDRLYKGDLSNKDEDPSIFSGEDDIMADCKNDSDDPREVVLSMADDEAVVVVVVAVGLLFAQPPLDLFFAIARPSEDAVGGVTICDKSSEATDD